MELIKISVPSLPDSIVSIPIDGYTYLIRMQWLQRAGLWMFTLSNSDGEELVSSTVTPNSNILFPIRSKKIPDGDFFVYKANESPLSYEDIASAECPLYFVSDY